MQDDLQEILDRLNWARSEIGVMSSEYDEWAQRTFRLLFEPHEREGFAGVVVEATETVPVSIRARSGTIANEIRSCLDSLASTLAAKNGHDEAYFPIATHEDVFTSDRRFRKRMSLFTQLDRQTILGFRPFARGIDGQPGNLLLYGLHHADIKRKHHRLVLKGANANLMVVNGWVGELTGEPDRLKVPGKTRIARISQDSRVTFNFKPDITYAEPDVLRGRPLVKTLHDFSDIAEAIVRAFL